MENTKEVYSKDERGELVFKADTKGGKWSFEVREENDRYDTYDYKSGRSTGFGGGYNKEQIVDRILDTLIGSKKIDSINYAISVDKLGVISMLENAEKVWDIKNSRAYHEWVKSLSQEEQAKMKAKAISVANALIQERPNIKDSDSDYLKMKALRGIMLLDYVKAHPEVKMEDGGEIVLPRYLEGARFEKGGALNDVGADMMAQINGGAAVIQPDGTMGDDVPMPDLTKGGDMMEQASIFAKGGNVDGEFERVQHKINSLKEKGYIVEEIKSSDGTYWKIGKPEGHNFEGIGYHSVTPRNYFYHNRHAGNIHKPDKAPNAVWNFNAGNHKDKPHGWYTFSEREIMDVLDKLEAEKFAAGGSIHEGKNTYKAFYKGKSEEVKGDTQLEARDKAAAFFKAKKAWDVSVVLMALGEEEVVHSTSEFAKGGAVGEKIVLKAPCVEQKNDRNGYRWVLKIAEPAMKSTLHIERDFKKQGEWDGVPSGWYLGTLLNAEGFYGRGNIYGRKEAGDFIFIDGSQGWGVSGLQKALEECEHILGIEETSDAAFKEADALWLTKWFATDASKEDSKKILRELNRRINAGELKGEDKKIIIEFLENENALEKTVRTKDGFELEKGTNKYRGDIFYDEEGVGYQCLGYFPKLDDCIYINLKTGKDVVGCMDGFYLKDPTGENKYNPNYLPVYKYIKAEAWIPLANMVKSEHEGKKAKHFTESNSAKKYLMDFLRKKEMASGGSVQEDREGNFTITYCYTDEGLVNKEYRYKHLKSWKDAYDTAKVISEDAIFCQLSDDDSSAENSSIYFHEGTQIMEKGGAVAVAPVLADDVTFSFPDFSYAYDLKNHPPKKPTSNPFSGKHGSYTGGGSAAQMKGVNTVYFRKQKEYNAKKDEAYIEHFYAEMAKGKKPDLNDVKSFAMMLNEKGRKAEVEALLLDNGFHKGENGLWKEPETRQVFKLGGDVVPHEDFAGLGVNEGNHWEVADPFATYERGGDIADSVLDKAYFGRFKIKGNGRREYTIFQSHGDSAYRQAANQLFPKLTYAEHEKRAKKYAKLYNQVSKEYNKLVDEEFLRVFERPYEATDYKVSGIVRDEFSREAKDAIHKELNTMAELYAAICLHNSVLNKADKIDIHKLGMIEKQLPKAEIIERLGKKIGTPFTSNGGRAACQEYSYRGKGYQITTWVNPTIKSWFGNKQVMEIPLDEHGNPPVHVWDKKESGGTIEEKPFAEQYAAAVSALGIEANPSYKYQNIAKGNLIDLSDREPSIGKDFQIKLLTNALLFDKKRFEETIDKYGEEHGGRKELNAFEWFAGKVLNMYEEMRRLQNSPYYESVDAAYKRASEMFQIKKYEKGGSIEPVGEESYETLTYKTKKGAEKSETEIKTYFGERLLRSEILFGKDERGNEGFYVKYVLIKEQYAKGGSIDVSEFQDGFTVEQMRAYLKKEFPDSFKFVVHAPEKGTRTALLRPEIRTSNGLTDSEIGSALLFPSIKNRGEAFHVYQGGENTYFDFALEDVKGDKEYIGSFGFKDGGDVPKTYITRFIAFLQAAYGLPFQVEHTVFEKGGEVNDVMVDDSFVNKMLEMSKDTKKSIAKAKEIWDSLSPKQKTLFRDKCDEVDEYAFNSFVVRCDVSLYEKGGSVDKLSFFKNIVGQRKKFSGTDEGFFSVTAKHARALSIKELKEALGYFDERPESNSDKDMLVDQIIAAAEDAWRFPKMEDGGGVLNFSAPQIGAQMTERMVMEDGGKLNGVSVITSKQHYELKQDKNPHEKPVYLLDFTGKEKERIEKVLTAPADWESKNRYRFDYPNGSLVVNKHSISSTWWFNKYEDYILGHKIFSTLKRDDEYYKIDSFDEFLVFLEEFVPKGVKEYAKGGSISDSFELGTPAVYHSLNYRKEPIEQSGEIVMRDGVKGISLYRDGNYSGSEERFVVPEWKNVESFSQANKRQQQEKKFKIMADGGDVVNFAAPQIGAQMTERLVMSDGGNVSAPKLDIKKGYVWKNEFYIKYPKAIFNIETNNEQDSLLKKVRNELSQFDGCEVEIVFLHKGKLFFAPSREIKVGIISSEYSDILFPIYRRDIMDTRFYQGGKGMGTPYSYSLSGGTAEILAPIEIKVLECGKIDRSYSRDVFESAYEGIKKVTEKAKRNEYAGSYAMVADLKLHEGGNIKMVMQGNNEKDIAVIGALVDEFCKVRDDYYVAEAVKSGDNYSAAGEILANRREKGGAVSNVLESTIGELNAMRMADGGAIEGDGLFPEPIELTQFEFARKNADYDYPASHSQKVIVYGFKVLDGNKTAYLVDKHPETSGGLGISVFNDKTDKEISFDFGTVSMNNLDSAKIYFLALQKHGAFDFAKVRELEKKYTGAKSYSYDDLKNLFQIGDKFRVHGFIMLKGVDEGDYEVVGGGEDAVKFVKLLKDGKRPSSFKAPLYFRKSQLLGSLNTFISGDLNGIELLESSLVPIIKKHTSDTFEKGGAVDYSKPDGIGKLDDGYYVYDKAMRPVERGFTTFEEASKKYFGGRKKKPVYHLGDLYDPSFDYKGLYEVGTKVLDFGVDELEKLRNSFSDVNFHQKAEWLSDIIALIKDGKHSAATVKLNEFADACKEKLVEGNFEKGGAVKSQFVFKKRDKKDVFGHERMIYDILFDEIGVGYIYPTKYFGSRAADNIKKWSIARQEMGVNFFGETKMFDSLDEAKDYAIKNYSPDAKFEKGGAINLYNAENAQQFKEELNTKINALVVKANVSTLGGANNPYITISVSLEPRDKWENGIFENSKYARFSIDRSGKIERFSANRMPAKFRACTVDTWAKAIEKINKNIEENGGGGKPSGGIEPPKTGNYMGNAGDKVMINKTGEGDKALYHLINTETSAKVDMFFDSEDAAKSYANKRGLTVIDNSGKIIVTRTHKTTGKVDTNTYEGIPATSKVKMEKHLLNEYCVAYPDCNVEVKYEANQSNWGDAAYLRGEADAKNIFRLHGLDGIREMAAQSIHGKDDYIKGRNQQAKELLIFHSINVVGIEKAIKEMFGVDKNDGVFMTADLTRVIQRNPELIPIGASGIANSHLVEAASGWGNINKAKALLVERGWQFDKMEKGGSVNEINKTLTDGTVVKFHKTKHNRTIENNQVFEGTNDFVINGEPYVVGYKTIRNANKANSTTLIYDGKTFPDNEKMVIEYILANKKERGGSVQPYTTRESSYAGFAKDLPRIMNEAAAVQAGYRDEFMKEHGLNYADYDKWSPAKKEKVQDKWIGSKQFRAMNEAIDATSYEKGGGVKKMGLESTAPAFKADRLLQTQHNDGENNSQHQIKFESGGSILASLKQSARSLGEAATKAYHKTEEAAKDAYGKGKAAVEKKVHDEKRDIALGVINKVRHEGDITHKQAEILHAADNIVDEKFELGGEIDSRALSGYDEYCKNLWSEPEGYFSKSQAQANYASYIQMQKDLNEHKITPKSVVGGGYINGRKVAEQWIKEQIAVKEKILSTDGKSNGTTQSNFIHHVLSAKNNGEISVEEAAKLMFDMGEYLPQGRRAEVASALGKEAFEKGGSIWDKEVSAKEKEAIIKASFKRHGFDPSKVLSKEHLEKMASDTYILSQEEWLNKYPIGDYLSYKEAAARNTGVEHVFENGGGIEPFTDGKLKAHYKAALRYADMLKSEQLDGLTREEFAKKETTEWGKKWGIIKEKGKHPADVELKSQGWDISTLTDEQKDVIIEPIFAPENYMHDGEITEAEARKIWTAKLRKSGLNEAQVARAKIMIMAKGGSIGARWIGKAKGVNQEGAKYAQAVRRKAKSLKWIKGEEPLTLELLERMKKTAKKEDWWQLDAWLKRFAKAETLLRSSKK